MLVRCEKADALRMPPAFGDRHWPKARHRDAERFANTANAALAPDFRFAVNPRPCIGAKVCVDNPRLACLVSLKSLRHSSDLSASRATEKQSSRNDARSDCYQA